MRKLHVGFMKDLRNNEFHSLYEFIIYEMEAAQLDDGDFTIALGIVKPHLEKFTFAFQARGKNEYSVANKDLTQERTNCLIYLRKQVDAAMWSYLPEDRVAARRINFVLDYYGKKYYVPTIKTQMVLVNAINHDLDNREVFRDAFTTLGINELMARINDLSQKINHNYLKRIMTNEERKEARAGVRRAAYMDLKVMIETINLKLMLYRHDEEKRAEIEALISEIDGHLGYFRKQFRIRITKQQNQKSRAATKQLIDTEQEVPIEPENEVQKVSPKELEIGSQKDIQNDIRRDYQKESQPLLQKIFPFEKVTSLSENSELELCELQVNSPPDCEG